METNYKLMELYASMLNLAKEVYSADGRKEFICLLDDSGVVSEHGEAARFHFYKEGHIFADLGVYRKEVGIFYIPDSSRSYQNSITVHPEIDFDATIKSVNELIVAFKKNGRESLIIERNKKFDAERKKLIERLHEINS